MTLRIRDWDKHFENAGSRKLKHLDWVSIPNKMDGSGYTALLDHPNGAAHLGAWYAMVEIASRQGSGPETRGYIPSLAGTCQCLSRISRIPAEVFEQVIPRLLEIGWLEEIKGLGDESPIICQNLPSSANEVAKTGGPVMSCSVVSSSLSSEKKKEENPEYTLPFEDSHAETPSDHPRVVRPAVQAATSEAAGWFAQWWAIYWSHKARGGRYGAENAFARHVKTEAQFQRVMAATREQTPEMLSREPSKRPYGATWLNGERWEDEVAAPVNGSGVTSSRPSSTDAVRALALRNLERTGHLL